MKSLKLFLLLSLTALLSVSCSDDKEKHITETLEDRNRSAQTALDEQFAKQWTEEERQQANSAAQVSYLSLAEREVFYYLNLLRMNPVRFANTYANAYTGMIGWKNGYAFDERKASLLQELRSMKPLPLLRPDDRLFESAECLASNGGRLGLIGHDRSGTGCKENIGLAECCSAKGYGNGLPIVMDFLIDAGENNTTLGHRHILLNGLYEWMGVAIRQHKDYGAMVVMDFHAYQP
ncbi:MAG: hypothetical protein J5552_06430 [Prevotella sp.]|nr:hypothetical protein [Prevotella sp.]